jgi:glycosyltransferase involved in cell wall biosynthesis
MKTLPLVTIITPAYNRAGFLEETILSVLNQNYPNLEYIVLDDGSTDDTVNRVKQFDNKLIFKSHRNIGEVATVNKGFSMAHGEIIGVVNSDDPLLPGAINQFVKFLQENPEIVVAYSDWIVIDGKGRKIKNVVTKDYDYKYMLKTHNCPLGGSAFFRKELLTKLKGRDASFKYVSDYDFWLRAGLIGEFARIPKFLVTSRVHAGQATFEHRSLGMALEHIRVLNKIFASPNFPPEYKKIKPEAYRNASEAVRISRGDSYASKIMSFFISLYYAKGSYLKMFIKFRLASVKKRFNLAFPSSF